MLHAMLHTMLHAMLYAKAFPALEPFGFYSSHAGERLRVRRVGYCGRVHWVRACLHSHAQRNL